jgi:hypothetical protein
MALDGVMTGDEYLLGLDPFQKRQKKYLSQNAKNAEN